MNKDVQKTVLALLDEYALLEVDQSTYADTFTLRLSDLMVDSLSILELIYELEEKFKVTLQADSLIKLSTIADLIQAISLEIDPQFK